MIVQLNPGRTRRRKPGSALACRLQHLGAMSVKTMLPILGVGSAAVALGLAAARRRTSRLDSLPAGASRRARPSGIHSRQDEAENELRSPVALGSEFWDAPESESRLELEEQPRPAAPAEAYDALDIEDLSAEWLSRATEAPATDESELGFDADDPAEVPADSLSMISQASRNAAAFDAEELDDDLAEALDDDDRRAR